MSAPLSPNRLYAQLELGKGPHTFAAYDPRLHASPGMAVDRVSGPSSYRGPSRSTANGATRSGPLIATNGSQSVDMEPPSPLPTFAPFSPPNPIPSTLRPLNGEPADYISPSTLLSPAQDPSSLPSAAVNSLTNSFGKMGVNPPGKGVEDPAAARKAESKVKQSSLSQPTSPVKRGTS